MEPLTLGQPSETQPVSVLIVDDSKSYRHLMAAALTKWGFNVCEAEDGRQALQKLNQRSIHIVISDWEMPVMDGVALCQAIRSGDFGHYVYVILVTARQSLDDLVTGMESGADDFLSKPVNQSQLRARLHAAERVLTLESTLAARNEKLTYAYQQIESDLQVAAKLQHSFLPAHNLLLAGFEFDWMFLPSAYVSGDLLNYFPLGEYHIAFFSVDVAGHGVSAAMLSLAVLREFMAGRISSHLLLELSAEGERTPVAPHRVVGELNQRFCLDNEQVTSYYTLIYGVIDTRNGKGTLCQAGHPTPFIIRADGDRVCVGDGGMPVGLFEEAEYQDSDFNLDIGDRLYLYSDGIIECESHSQELYGDQRLQTLLSENRHLAKNQLFARVENALNAWRCHEPLQKPHARLMQSFADDISLMAVERIGVATFTRPEQL
ncbi:SpoIIE family protein phosphatase [Serratia sp. JSRIV001]|uniref:PP2C family protein-serine/threonine phosphatase n=1 Tax=Serratia TaxID=613 RepID=UPI00074310CF|nr:MULTISPECIES: SpoIIE family protein phosphatase [Serratia]ALX95474.1 response regulator [Serratia fonticola]MBP1034082.1 SpoIIE family protein phosphatase [Serratia fonticola]QXN61353.1 SpoIIE family protein phosphatase [Serratia fonticola]UAN43766.1 SpoIIE family protein phosphatase [Serratia sp. JSRIV001]UAN49340.1 SpoIIE family protein phosphatase [Serratia sp. JSRIV002]